MKEINQLTNLCSKELLETSGVPQLVNKYCTQPKSPLYLIHNKHSWLPVRVSSTIHFSITLSITRRSSKWSLSFTFPHQNPVPTSLLQSYMPHATPIYPLPPPFAPRRIFPNPNHIWWAVQIIKLLVTQYPPVSFHFHIVGPSSPPYFRTPTLLSQCATPIS